MPISEVQKGLARSHSLHMEAREKMSITGVNDVSGFDESLIVLTTAQGDLTVRGEGLHIEKIDLDSGQMEIRGHIQELSYEESSKSDSLWTRIFG